MGNSAHNGNYEKVKLTQDSFLIYIYKIQLWKKIESGVERVECNIGHEPTYRLNFRFTSAVHLELYRLNKSVSGSVRKSVDGPSTL